jgi:trehalose 6-phosphate phosphatase
MKPHSTPVHLRDCMGAWNEIRLHLEHAERLVILSDFDGTLSPLIDVPSAATIDPDVKMLLRRLCTHDAITVAVLSGRTVADVRDRIRLPLIFAGDHGLDIQGPGFEYAAPGSELVREHTPMLCARLRQNTNRFEGSLVEPKQFGASVHFRHVLAHELPDLQQAVRQSVDEGLYEIRSGKCVWEIRPRLKWDKGAAARWILDRCRASDEHVICLGDDCTDADMFRSLPRGVNIQIGFDGVDLGANYWLPQAEVAQFLACVLTQVVEAERRTSIARHAVGVR